MPTPFQLSAAPKTGPSNPCPSVYQIACSDTGKSKQFVGTPIHATATFAPGPPWGLLSCPHQGAGQHAAALSTRTRAC